MEPTDHPTPPFTVAQLAELAGITVRTLHHYDAIGLLHPADRTWSGYRLYGEPELARLREILVWRRLDVALPEIARLLDDPTADRRAVLLRQRELVAERLGELGDLAAALDVAIGRADEAERDMTQTDRDIIEALGGFDPADHAAEAHERWGDTDAWRESARRTGTYTADDWRRIRAEADALTDELAQVMACGAEPSSEAARALAERHRQHIDRWYYACSHVLHRALGDMYVADPRFTASYDGSDGARAGLAAWLRDAITANADAHESEHGA